MVTGSTEDHRSPQHTHRPAASRSGGGVAFGSFTVITDARSGASKELATRQRRYAITMAFRTACFIAMIFAPGVFRWILFACALFLPYVAVIFANQANLRDQGKPVGGGGPGDEPAVTTGRDRRQLPSSQVISGDVDEREAGDDQEAREDQKAREDQEEGEGDRREPYGRDDRVA